METMICSLVLMCLFGAICGQMEEGIRYDVAYECELLNEKVTKIEQTINIMADNRKTYDDIITKLQQEMDQLKENSNNMIQSLQKELNAVNKLLFTKNKAENGTLQNVEKRMILPNIPDVGGIAFTAAMNNHHENLGIHQIVKFDNVITNVGSGFDPVTSIFKAPVSGNYFFTVVIMSHAAEDIETQIVKNGVPLVNTYSGDSTTWNQGSQSVAVSLNTGDDVYVHIMDNKGVNDGNIRVFGGTWSSFSGFLISK